jgi:hypothetical protein
MISSVGHDPSVCYDQHGLIWALPPSISGSGSRPRSLLAILFVTLTLNTLRHFVKPDPTHLIGLAALASWNSSAEMAKFYAKITLLLFFSV